MPSIRDKNLKIRRSTTAAHWFAVARSRFTLRRAVFFIGIGAIIGFFCVTILIAWLTRDLPDPDHLQDRVIVESTKMYDRTGKHLLYELYDEKKRTIVNIAELPRYVVDATIAIEDSHFYEHKGIRWTSLVRAVAANVLRLNSGRGGASTLTQQLVKNAILTNERSFVRKIKEAILALQIERVYAKDQILKLYFNEIPYGSTNYGIESASQSYFGKPAKELTLAEAATLAALPQLPTKYLQNPSLLRGRRDYVLLKMHEQNYITEAHMKEAQSQNSDVHIVQTSFIAPHFVLYIKEQLVSEYGEKTVDQGGLKVITTLDYDLQKSAGEIVKKGVEAAEKKYNATNGALLSIDPNNGEILAMVGSRDYADDEHLGKFNVVTQGVRQPGSSFKPVVYAAAFEKGFPPETVLFDAVTDFPYDGRSYKPHNYDGREHGPVTMRKALQGSLNIPAVKTVFLVGVDDSLDFAERLGYSTFTDRSKFGPSVVLGGGGVRMIEHVRAFGVFANGGTLQDPIGLLKVEDRTGKDITPQKKNGTRVIDASVAATVSGVLSDNDSRAYIFGAKNYLTLSGRQVATKTGTTNDYHDAWTIGYTPQIVTGVWVGNNDNAVMKRGADGSVVAAPIWQQFMTEAVKKMPATGFPEPPKNTATHFMLRGDAAGGVAVEIDTVTGKRATADTPRETTEKRTFLPPHDILFYVDPANPLGAPPQNPASHPQFSAWEVGVERWLAGKVGDGISFDAPPTEFDDVHKKENRPTLVVVAPQTGTAVGGSEIVASIEVSAPLGVARVEYRLDGVLIGTATEFPFSQTLNLSSLKSGNHTLKVSAFDAVSNATTREVSFQYVPELAPTPPPVAAE
ncbi:MAG: hypothetical protein A2848_02455 [Candidatus Magasanikbacteria bacterium RIFCSPHIGHO2_01_FULL_50_8]|uniref:Uncharacterized protein n=2 Tax=Candidatus Magasanikiibacteriota TaxID=1752731 RepID=A0A1F6LSD6_9BACT|nr:MAG: hypothetical protein A2848_02455 [Candidatus Magasanikbacteria bacterium RIFCSPHIGHO2_01_FULL_50_8]